MATTPKQLDLTIYQGRTFRHIVRWETNPVVFKAITAITQGAPAEITAVAHGLKNGWSVAITDVKGMTQINADSNSPKTTDYRPVTVVDVDTITIDGLDSASFKAYTSSGYIRYYTPVGLSGYKARLDFKDKVGGTILLSLNETAGITLDDTNHTITIGITPAVTTLITWKKAVYDLELESPTGPIDAVLAGSVTVVPEVTTTP